MGHIAASAAATEIKFIYETNSPQLKRIEVIHDRKNRNYATTKYDIATSTLTIGNVCTDNGSPYLTSTKILSEITKSGRLSSNGAWDALPSQKFGYEALSNFDKAPFGDAANGFYHNGTCFNYYRLKQVDYNGAFDYSNLIKKNVNIRYSQ